MLWLLVGSWVDSPDSGAQPSRLSGFVLRLSANFEIPFPEFAEPMASATEIPEIRSRSALESEPQWQLVAAKGIKN
jgi:hypothetical protein